MNATEERTDLITRVEDRVSAIAGNEIDLTPDMAMELLDSIAGAKRRLNYVEGELKALIVPWMVSSCIKELVIGDERHFVTDKKREKCRSIPAAVQALFESVGGDFDAFCDTLSSNAIKYGQAKKVLGDKYPEHFESIVEKGLDHEPVKILASINTRFLGK